MEKLQLRFGVTHPLETLGEIVTSQSIEHAQGFHHRGAVERTRSSGLEPVVGGRAGQVKIGMLHQRACVERISSLESHGSDTRSLHLLTQIEELVPSVRDGPAVLTEQLLVVVDRPDHVDKRHAVGVAVLLVLVQTARQEGLSPACAVVRPFIEPPIQGLNLPVLD